MAVYQYKGLTAAGKTTAGMREADSVKTLRSLLKAEGIFLTEVAEGRAQQQIQGSTSIRRIFSSVNTEELSVMTRQMSTLLNAQIPLVEALTALIEQIDNEQLKFIVSQVKTRVNEGTGFADALADHPRVFSNLYINMIRAGESAGALDVVMLRLADYTEAQASLNSKIRAAMVYPMIMMGVGLVIMIGLFTFVIPKLTKIFDDIDAALPIYTRALIWFSNALGEYWYVFIIVIAAAIFAFRRWKNTASGRHQWDKFVLKVPVFGSLVRMLAISRFTRTLATLLDAGVPLLTGMDIVKNIIENKILIEVIDATRDAVKEGAPIADPLKRSGEFPPIVTHMIAVGEKTGRLVEMLNKVADSYNAQIDTRISTLTTILEPIMILVMGGSVGFVVISILVPILQISEFAQ
jgi:general secretion pathway protein F